jgi:hypothetical protein
MRKARLRAFRLLTIRCRHSSSNQFAPACFVSRPPAQVEARRLVTAGHGPFTSGRPARGHAGHGQSRRCRSGHGRHGVGPAARPPTAWIARFAIGGRSLCWARHGSLASRSEGDRSVGHGSPRTLVRSSLRSRCCRRDLAATLRSRRRSKSTQARGATSFCCWAVVATPLPAPGS